MKTYYCERFDTLRPEFANYKTKRETKEEALEFFRQKHGEQLECVYDEDFNMVWEAKPGTERVKVKLVE